jgi:hypothetical protein
MTLLENIEPHFSVTIRIGKSKEDLGGRHHWNARL